MISRDCLVIGEEFIALSMRCAAGQHRDAIGGATGLPKSISKFRAKMMKPMQSSTTQSNIKSKMNRSPPTKMLKWLTPGSVSSSVTAYSETLDGARQ